MLLLKKRFLTFYCFSLAILTLGIQGIASFASDASPTENNFSQPLSFNAEQQPLESSFLRGLQIYPDRPLTFNFFITHSQDVLSLERKNEKYQTLLKYFLAALTIPETDLWVNLSAHEKELMTAKNFGETEMGHHLLNQDYQLKKITTSLLSPDHPIGAKFWTAIYQKIHQDRRTTNIPLETFQKIWIIPDKAVVRQKENTAWVIYERLKVMLDEDYVDPLQSTSKENLSKKKFNKIFTRTMRQIIVPAIEQEINTNENFIPLRQMYTAMILASWYKRTLKSSILSQVYADKGKVDGLKNKGSDTKENIYARYIEALAKGTYNSIREEFDPLNREIIVRQYFAGGVTGLVDPAMTVIEMPSQYQQFTLSIRQSINENFQFGVDRVTSKLIPHEEIFEHQPYDGNNYAHSLNLSKNPQMQMDSNNTNPSVGFPSPEISNFYIQHMTKIHSESLRPPNISTDTAMLSEKLLRELDWPGEEFLPQWIQDDNFPKQKILSLLSGEEEKIKIFENGLIYVDDKLLSVKTSNSGRTREMIGWIDYIISKTQDLPVEFKDGEKMREFWIYARQRFTGAQKSGFESVLAIPQYLNNHQLTVQSKSGGQMTRLSIESGLTIPSRSHDFLSSQGLIIRHDGKMLQMIPDTSNNPNAPAIPLFTDNVPLSVMGKANRLMLKAMDLDSRFPAMWEDIVSAWHHRIIEKSYGSFKEAFDQVIVPLIQEIIVKGSEEELKIFAHDSKYLLQDASPLFAIEKIPNLESDPLNLTPQERLNFINDYFISNVEDQLRKIDITSPGTRYFVELEFDKKNSYCIRILVIFSEFDDPPFNDLPATREVKTHQEARFAINLIEHALMHFAQRQQEGNDVDVQDFLSRLKVRRQTLTDELTLFNSNGPNNKDAKTNLWEIAHVRRPLKIIIDRGWGIRFSSDKRYHLELTPEGVVRVHLPDKIFNIQQTIDFINGNVEYVYNVTTDAAITAPVKPGGVNFDAALLSLEVKIDTPISEEATMVPSDSAILSSGTEPFLYESLQDVKGFSPVILKIKELPLQSFLP